MEQTRAFMLRHARPLDWARWRYHFEGGSAEDVLTALAAYQNTDGGFGHGLEADCWNPASSPIMTWRATTVLRELGYPEAAQPMIRSMVRYLSGGDAFDGQYWYAQIPSNNDHPHAPWWGVGSDGPKGDDNPTASLSGFLLRFGKGESRVLGERLVSEAITRLMERDTIRDSHLLDCYLELQEHLSAMGDPRAEVIEPRLIAMAEDCVCREPDKWFTTYCCKPSFLLHSRESILYPSLKALAAQECDMLPSLREDNGAWPVTWDWHAYPEAWPVARLWWQGDIAVKNMLFLRQFSDCLQS